LPADGMNGCLEIKVFQNGLSARRYGSSICDLTRLCYAKQHCLGETRPGASPPTSPSCRSCCVSHRSPLSTHFCY